MKYIINTSTPTSGAHELHQDTCSHLPAWLYQRPLGDFMTESEAEGVAKKMYMNISKCAYCIGHQ